MSDGPAEEILRARLARGEIDDTEYRERLGVLRSAPPANQPPRTRWLRTWMAAVLILLVAGATVAIVGMSSKTPIAAGLSGGPTCEAPNVAGPVVNVTLTDMGGGMMGGAMGGRTMRVLVGPRQVAAGEVSFRVWNAGNIEHELVVLPLPAGRSAGTRAVGSDGRVGEAGSLGEASRSCASGAGNGIRPGATGWVTLRLVPGRYELVCNLPGHYAAGMFAELDVR